MMKPTTLNWYWIGRKLFYMVWFCVNLLCALCGVLVPFMTVFCFAGAVFWNAIMLRLEFETRSDG